MEFEKAFKSLNREQLEAVKTIEGPVLVMAGPGTGKTQLISTRIGHILKTTDTPPEAILCLTFTEAGASSMRERLASLLGRAAYDVQISTYHAFGSDLIRRYPDFFEDTGMQALDSLEAEIILRSVLDELPYANPLKNAEMYLGDIKSFISDCKRALLTPDQVRAVAAGNIGYVKKVNELAFNHLQDLARISKKSLPVFSKLLDVLSSTPSKATGSLQALGETATSSLSEALTQASQDGNTKALTLWKRQWLERDAEGQQILSGARINHRLLAAADIYEDYQKQLKARSRFDYDDMILRAIEALEANTDFKYTVSERYLYLLLDEFQDTNAAQLKLIELLTDNPVHERRPNVLAVGDDDQAIYAFQGADYANMTGFINLYQDVKLIGLSKNYRSHQTILNLADFISGQIKHRLRTDFAAINQPLSAETNDFKISPKIDRQSFKNDAGQYAWVTSHIHKLKKADPETTIAVLAPKHRYLMELLPYLAAQKIAVEYERRDNILETPMVIQLVGMANLTLALGEPDDHHANALWPEILSYDFWGLPTDKLWTISWQARRDHKPWTATLLEDKATADIVKFFLTLKDRLATTSLEQQLDGLIGNEASSGELNLPMISPFFNYYFSRLQMDHKPISYVDLLSKLTVLRSRLRQWHSDREEPLSLRDFSEYVDGHRAARLPVLDTSPYREASNAVQLMTAYQAKGREFDAVFVISAQDEVWGSASKNQGNRLALPPNLKVIRYRGMSDDERLRLFFVALTRARAQLLMTAVEQNFNGRTLTPLKYLIEPEDQPSVLPAAISSPAAASEPLELGSIEPYWQSRHLPQFTPKLRVLLTKRLQDYRLSASDLNSFVDVAGRGPDNFLLYNLLQFPTSPTAASGYGDSIHKTLNWLHQQLVLTGELPTTDAAKRSFSEALLAQRLPTDVFSRLQERGQDTLDLYLAARGPSFNKDDKHEVRFRDENIVVNDARLTGNIDRLVIDQKRRTITIVDFKTGRAYSRWEPGITKLQLYRQQLLFYKLLVENSRTYKGYIVEKGIVEFVEADDFGRLQQLELNFTAKDVDDFKSLIGTIWKHIQDLDLPIITQYKKDASGIRQFEQDLCQ